MTFETRLIKTALALCAAFIYAASAAAQDAEVKQLGTTELKDQAMSLVNDKRYLEARPYMAELVTRISDSDDANLKRQLEDLYFFTAYSYVQEYDATKDEKLLKKALEYFDRVVREFPGGKMANAAIDVEANCYIALGDLVKAATCRERLLEPPYSNGLSNAKRYEIVKKIADSLFAAGKWQEGEKWFKLKLEGAKDPEDKVSAASALIQAATNLKKFDDLKNYLKYMSIDTVSRSDLGLNMALLQAGDKLVEQKRYSEASALYSMVFGRDKILKNLTSYVDKTKKRVELMKRINPTNPQIAELDNKLKSIEFSIGKINDDVSDYTADLMLRSSRNYMLTNRDYESFWSYMQLLDPKFKDHSAREDFFYAAIIGAYKIGKNEEMYKLCQEYLKDFPDGQYYNDAQLRIAQYWLGKKNYPEFFSVARKFVEEYPDESPYSNDLVFLMGRTWLETENYKELIKTYSKYVEDFEDSGISDGLLYWLGMGYMAAGDFQNAGKTFGQITENYPVSPYAEDAGYRQGVALFGIGDFPKARDALENFVKSYPSSSLRGEVEFFLGDIYANSMAVKEAIGHYMSVEKFTKNQDIIDNAYTQAAKLLMADSQYEEVVKLMDKYLSEFKKDGIPSTINSQKALALEKLGLPADALEIYRTAIDKYGDNPRDDGVDKMILDYDRLHGENFDMLNATVAFIEKLMSDRELLYNMVEVPAERYRYFVANPKIDKRIYEKFKRDTSFGPNLYNDKSNIKALLERYRGQLAKYPQKAGEFFSDMLKKAEDGKRRTLANRLMMGLDSIGSPVQVAKMFDEDDIKNSSVRTLAWIGKVNEKFGPDQARKAFAEAAARDEYKYLIDVLFASAALETRQTNWDKVLALYEQIETDFPSDPRAAEAALKKADTFMALGKRKEAEAKYEEILKSPSWRGDSYAEALFKLGNIARDANDANKAIMYYERCFLGYANCLNWTGKAVIQAAKVLAASGKRDEGRAICKEFAENESNKKSPDYEEVKQLELTI